MIPSPGDEVEELREVYQRGLVIDSQLADILAHEAASVSKGIGD